MRVSWALLCVGVALTVVVFPAEAQFTGLDLCNVTEPKPTYDEVPIEECLQNLGSSLSTGVSCASVCTPSGTSCTNCRHYEWLSNTITTPFCLPLTVTSPLQLGDATFTGQLRCIPMRIAPTLSETFTTLNVPSGPFAGTYTPATFDAELLNGARGMTTSNFVCGMRDPSKSILDSTTLNAAFSGAFDGPRDINDVSVVTTGDVDLGFSFQQVIACLQETGTPSEAPTPMPTLSPGTSPANTLTMSFTSLALMLGFTLF